MAMAIAMAMASLFSKDESGVPVCFLNMAIGLEYRFQRGQPRFYIEETCLWSSHLGGGLGSSCLGESLHVAYGRATSVPVLKKLPMACCP